FCLPLGCWAPACLAVGSKFHARVAATKHPITMSVLVRVMACSLNNKEMQLAHAVQPAAPKLRAVGKKDESLHFSRFLVHFFRTPRSPAGPAARTWTSKGRNAGPVRLYVQFHSRHRSESTLTRGVARRSFGLVRHDLWLQIDPRRPKRS